MKVLIADDHAVVRQGLKQILADEFPAASFGEATNATEALAMLARGKWELMLLDVSMPGRSGLEILKEARRARPRLPILVLSMHPEDQYAVRMLKAGASGYLTKETAPEELARAVRKVMAGGKYINAATAEQLAASLDSAPGEHAPHEALSDREFQVLRMIALGKSVKQIAGDLSLSVKTVSTYRTRVLSKMNMKTNADLTRYGIERRLAD